MIAHVLRRNRSTLSQLAAGCFAVLALGLAACNVGVTDGSYTNFETIPTRALALSPNGTRLFAANVPDGRLEIFAVTSTGLVLQDSVTVGLEPIAVAARSDNEVWVVNHLSDSVSVVDVRPGRKAIVIDTLLVGDEPRDIVFAANNRRAFITAARRGQNHPADTVAEQQQPGIGRADVWVFDAQNRAAAPNIVQLFGDKPGPLAVSPNGRTVYAAIFSSGNQTTVINESALCGSGNLSVENPGGPCMAPGGVPAPNFTTSSPPAQSARTGLIVKFDPADGSWRDAAGRDWRRFVPYTLPDLDVFEIDATANPPREVGSFAGVGTINNGMVVHPTTGQVFVSTTEAINTNRFVSAPTLGLFSNPAGPVLTADPATGKTLNGHLYESRIAILQNTGQRVRTRHLNKHIDYEVVPSPPGTAEHSVASPNGITFSRDGSELFVAALGSNKVVPFSTAELESDAFVPDASTHIPVAATGPTDIVRDDANGRLYVYGRFNNAISTIDLRTRRQSAVTFLTNPEPGPIRGGRPFFYDALITSTNGEANCAVCHPAGDKDDLAWNLGSPFAGLSPNPNPFVPGLRPPDVRFNPLKGPMTVLTLRGIADGGPMFWRGEATNDVDPLDERANFQNFNVVFPALLGRADVLPDADFQAFTDWALSIMPPPNPHRNLDNSLTARQQQGQAIFNRPGVDGGAIACVGCHRLDPAQGFFGTGGEMTVEGEPQLFKVTQLRSAYDKVGMFGFPGSSPANPTPIPVGDQIRGSGTLHDGSVGGVEQFVASPVFQINQAEESLVAEFVSAFPAPLAPIVGQQITLSSTSPASVDARINLMRQRARTPFVMKGNPGARECELIAKTTVGVEERGYVMQPDGTYLDDRGQTISDAALRMQARSARPVTFTCAYPRAGRRLGIDRDADGVTDALDNCPTLANPMQDPAQACR